MSSPTQKEINRNSLLSQGVSLLMQQGYHGTGLKEILDAVQIPKGSFYNYFGSKENFTVEVIQHYIEPFILQLDLHLKQHENNTLLALQDYFNELIMELEKADFKGGCLLGNLMGELADTSVLCQQSLRKAVHNYRDLLLSGIEKAQQQGTVRKDKPAVELADLLTDAWQGALLRMKIEKSSMPLKVCTQNILGDFFKTQC